MMADLLISPRDLRLLIREGSVIVIDCRFSLQDPGLGREAYSKSHVPGAHYAHLDEDLSAPVVPGKTGRHPLPDAARVEKLFRSWGIGKDSAVVVYDQENGCFAARAWWLLKWAGVSNVRLLNGGWEAWTSAGLPVSPDEPADKPSSFTLSQAHRPVLDMTAIRDFVSGEETFLVDARAAERFDGETEPIDPVAGHIPGAVNLPWMMNVRSDGSWLPEDQVRQHFAHIGVTGHEDVGVYCGSGVTACHVAFAFEYAGLGIAKLYPGSWSEWITDPENPVARDEG